MALISLGTKDVSLPYQWVAFNSVMLLSEKFYVLYFDVQSVNFDEVYSTFTYRISGQIQNGLACSSAPLGLVEAVANTQVAKLVIDKYWDENFPVIIELRRNIFLSNQSNLADTQVQLRIDPNESYSL